MLWIKSIFVWDIFYSKNKNCYVLASWDPKTNILLRTKWKWNLLFNTLIFFSLVECCPKTKGFSLLSQWTNCLLFTMLENSIFIFSDVFHVAFYFLVECLPVLRGIDFGVLGIKRQKKKISKNQERIQPMLVYKCKIRLSKFHMSDLPAAEGKSFYQMSAKVPHCHWSKSSEALKSQQAKLGIFSGHMKTWLKRDSWKWIANILKATYI